MRVLIFALLLLNIFSTSITSAQNVTGQWYGVGKVKKAGEHNSYLSEMLLRQRGNKVTGQLNYFYRSAEIKTKVTGTYDPRFKVLELNATPMLNFLARNEQGADCPMEGSFTLKIINGKKILVGQFNPTYDYRITCPAIDVRFTRSFPKKNQPVETPEPEEIEKPAVVPRDSLIKKPSAIARPDKPLTEAQKAELALKTRSFEVVPVIDVDADSLKITLYDNGEVDNDTISVFIDRRLLKSRQMLTDKGYSFNVPLDTTVKEISMFAENLGRIPPNTALAVIYAGEQRFELNLTSTYNKNAVIRFRRKTKQADPKNIN
ncbi:MAG TPA: hypothetical protein VF540_08535 [Segetibacter sp.]